MLHPRIERDPAVMTGKPVVKGTQVTVELILRRLGAGDGLDRILADYPQLSEADVHAAQAFAADLLARESLIDRMLSDPEIQVEMRRQKLEKDRMFGMLLDLLSARLSEWNEEPDKRGSRWLMNIATEAMDRHKIVPTRSLPSRR